MSQKLIMMHNILTPFVVLILFFGCESKNSHSEISGSQEVSISIADVVISDTTFQAPDSIPAGYVKVKLSNRSSAMHSAHLIRLKDNCTSDQLIEAYTDSLRNGGGRPNWMTHVGGVIGEPGESEIVLLLRPGKYVWVCVLGGDEEPHFAGRESKELVVFGSIDESQKLSDPELTIKMDDENFEINEPVQTGRQSIDIINSGSKYHLAAISKLNQDASADDVKTWFANYAGPPPAIGIIATSAIGPGLGGRINVNFEKGKYVLYCMANAEGRFHLLDGAIRTFEVK